MGDTILQEEVNVRYARIIDHEEILAISNISHNKPWTHKEFEKFGRDRNCVAIVAEYNNEIVGYILYKSHKKFITIMDLTVHPNHRRKGIGTKLVDQMKNKLNPPNGRVKIETFVDETNLGTQLFLKHVDFIATETYKDLYDDKDAYLFEHFA